MIYSYLKNSPQAQAYFASLPQPGTFSPHVMSPSGAIAPAPVPARVAAVKKQVAVPVVAQPMLQTVHGALPAILPTHAAPVAQPAPKSGFTGLVKQALQAIKGRKWYVVWPFVIGLMFLAFKALALEVTHDADLSVAAPSVAASVSSAGDTAVSKIAATQKSAATATEPLTTVTTVQPFTANNVATNNGANNSETGIVLKPTTVIKANSKDTKPPVSVQDLRLLGTKLAAVEEKLAVAEALSAGQAQAMAKLQEQNIAAVIAANMAHAISPTGISAATNTPLSVASIDEAKSKSNRGAEWALASLASVGFIAITLGALTLGWRWKRASALSANQARYNNKQNGTSGLQPVPQSSAEQSVLSVATSPALTRGPELPAVDATAPTTVVLRPIATPDQTFPVSSSWSFGSFGLKGPIRDEMQDAYAHFMLPGGAFAVVVADGVGGEPHGAMAAQLAVAATKASLLTNAQVSLTETLDAVDAAGRAIAEHAKQYGIQYGLRTTLMVMVRIGNTAHYACLGDGGLYHLRGNDGIVTTLFQPQRDKAGYLLASLGPNTAGQPLAGSLHLASGDILLSGTDGIWERTPDAAALATWLVQSMRRTDGDVQASLQNSLAEFVQIQNGGSFVADDNASIGCLGTGSAPAFLYPQQTFSQLQTAKELSYA